MHLTLRVVLGVFVSLWLAAAALAQDAVLNQAKAHLDRGEARAAYELLKPLESKRAGDPAFDLLLGTAALDTRRPSEAVFALERVLAVNPKHAVARTLIARAYFELGETRAARQEFESARKLAPPAEITATIQRFLDAIARYDAGIETRLTGYLEASLGYDTNVNSATSANQIAIPAFGGALFELSPAGVKADDYFFSVGGGLNFRHSFTHGVAAVAGLDANKRFNGQQDAFDTGYWNAFAGFNVIHRAHSFTVALQGQQFYLDKDRFRDAYGATGQWQYAIDDFNSLTAYLQYTALEYPTQSIRDADRTVGGLGYARALEGDRNPVLFLGGYVGEEREKASGVPHLGHQLWGLRLGGQLSLRHDLTLFASGSVEQRDYGGADPLFATTRRDTQFDLRVGVNYVPAKFWTVTPQVSFTRNESNVIINEFERAVGFVTVRRDFK